MEQSPSEKLTLTHLVMKFPVFHGTRRFITVFTDPYSEEDASQPILILSSHVRLGLPSGLFLSSFPTNIFKNFLSLPCTICNYWNWTKLVSVVTLLPDRTELLYRHGSVPRSFFVITWSFRTSYTPPSVWRYHKLHSFNVRRNVEIRSRAPKTSQRILMVNEMVWSCVFSRESHRTQPRSTDFYCVSMKLSHISFNLY
jgi:hypothetical protein